MNVFRFINSRDIRKHLEELKYEFNALEAAWLVYQCKDTTLEERHKAWTWIVDNMPDMEVPKRSLCIYRESLHDTLRKYMAMEDDLLARFCSSEEGVFTIGRYCHGGTLYDDGWADIVSYSLDECIERIKEELVDYKDTSTDSADGSYYEKFWDSNCPAVVKHFKHEKYRIQVSYGPDCSVRRVSLFGRLKDISADYLNLLSMFFEGLWFEFPTPFKKGDIVCMINDDLEGPHVYAFCSGVFVLEDILPGKLDKEQKKLFLDGEQGDTSDMTAYGIFIQKDGTIYRECTHNYMDLEFYHGPLNGARRTFKALSNYIKGEIDLDLLLYSYRVFVMERNLEDFKQWSKWFTDEGKRLAGLLEEEI